MCKRTSEILRFICKKKKRNDYFVYCYKTGRGKPLLSTNYNFNKCKRQSLVMYFYVI